MSFGLLVYTIMTCNLSVSTNFMYLVATLKQCHVIKEPVRSSGGSPTLDHVRKYMEQKALDNARNTLQSIETR